MAIFSVIPPFVVVSTVLGAVLVSVVAVAFPPPFRIFPRILLAGIVGSLVGQLLAVQLNVADPLFGDAHLLGIGAGALLVSSVVRRLSA
jgi:hypothetical protein